MTLVYLRESRRLRNARGMMTSLVRCISLDEMGAALICPLAKGDTHIKAVTQKCRSTRNPMLPASSLKAMTTPGIKSPMMIK